jgi:hypothetical protein
MHFLSYGDGHAGGVCSFTKYLQANEDGAWVGLERYPHPTDTQYSWTSRLAEVYSARNKSFCRHNASIESILQEVQESINMYEFDECYFFIGLPDWKRRLYPLYGDWGSAKDHLWSKHYEEHGIDCNMDGTEFDKEYGKKLIGEVLRTNGVKRKDVTFKTYYDQQFGGLLSEKGLSLGGNSSRTDMGDHFVSNDLEIQYHPGNELFDKVIDEFLDIKESIYLNECERINAISPKKQNDMNIHYMPELLKLLELIKESKHKFYFYFTETLWNMPNVEEKTIIHGEEVQLNLENTYWFWNICMKKFFEEDLDNARPKTNDYYQHEDHYQFSRYMRRNITEQNLI